MSQMLTIKDVAAQLKIGVRTAYRLIEEGQIPAKRVGTGRGTIRVRPTALEAYLNQPDDGPAGQPAQVDLMEIL
jgi:excisionase family DNA binding protein